MTELKRKIGLYMPFLMRKPDKRARINHPLVRRYFSYKNSYINNTNIISDNPKYFYKLKLHINLILIDENSYFHKLKTMYDCITK